MIGRYFIVMVRFSYWIIRLLIVRCIYYYGWWGNNKPEDYIVLTSFIGAITNQLSKNIGKKNFKK